MTSQRFLSPLNLDLRGILFGTFSDRVPTERSSVPCHSRKIQIVKISQVYAHI